MKQNTHIDTSQALAIATARALDDKKAEDIIVIDVSGLCNFTNYFIIATGLSTLQFRSISRHVQEVMRSHGEKPFHVDGEDEGSWLIMDYHDVIVHVFSPESRAYYDLERLWGDGVMINWQDDASAES